MMKHLLLSLILVLALPSQGEAQTMTVREFYVRELREDGYETIRISRTWLGRLRFIATQPGRRREIVVNPANGAILRDYVRRVGSRDDGGNGPSYSSGGGYQNDDENGGYDDHDDDEDDDDDDHDDEDDEDDRDDEDNSGPGSSNSGSGSSGDDDDDD